MSPDLGLAVARLWIALEPLPEARKTFSVCTVRQSDLALVLTTLDALTTANAQQAAVIKRFTEAK